MDHPAPHFHVRRVTSAEIPVLRTLRLEALSDTPDAFGSTYEREVARTSEEWQRWLSPGVVFFLEADGAVAGMVAGAPDKEDSSTVWLMAMWVRATLRGTPAAAELVSAVKSLARELGAREVRLKVIDTNLRARRFYERTGFQLTGRQNPRERDGLTELEMAWDVESG
jgi:RimJ/RimL family protein N-acetyltransferase